MIDTIEELDLSKENIQPLKRGRVISQLGNALRAQTDATASQELLKEKEKFELKLRSYEGDDPLENWYEYVLWVEQSFPRTAREGNLSTILERSIKQFKNHQQYHQDVRFIEIWLKYIELSATPLELFKRCIQHGIGKYSALFYVAWAHELENNNDVKRANQVLNEGLMNHAQPKDHLIKAQHDLQVRVGRAMLGQEVELETIRAEQRIALNSLKTHGRKKLVNNVRIGSNSQRGPPGILQPLHDTRNRDNIHSGGISVYDDEEENVKNAEFAMVGTGHLAGTVQNEILTKENVLKPGPWTRKSARKQIGTSIIRPQQPQHPGFQLHEDEITQEKKVSTIIWNALKPRKLDMDEFNCPLAIFEPEDPTMRVMYCKNKVYAGGSEVSFEELRAMEYLKGNRIKRDKQDCERQNRPQQNVPFQAFDTQNPVKVGEDDFVCPVAIFEPDDPSKKPMYCKNKVYPGNGKELSLEEIRAAEYFKGYVPRKYCEDQDRSQQNVPFQAFDAQNPVKVSEDDFVCPVAIFEPDDPTKRPMYCKNKVYPGNGKELSLEEIRAAEYFKEIVSRKHEQLNEERDNQEQIVPLEVNNVQKPEELIGDGFVCPVGVFKTNVSTETSKDEAQVQNSLADILPGDVQDLSSAHWQSMTCHTKEAFNIMEEIWRVPGDGLLACVSKGVEGASVKRKTISSTKLVDLEQPQCEKKAKCAFEIFADEEEFKGGRDVEPIKPLLPFSNVEPVFSVENHPNKDVEDIDEPNNPLQHKLNRTPFVIPCEENEEDCNELFNLFPKQSNCVSHFVSDNKNEEGKQSVQSAKSSSLEYEIEFQGICSSNSCSTSIPTSQGSKLQFGMEHSDGSASRTPSDVPVFAAEPIPTVPSPGMTKEELEAMQGTENKENDPPKDYVQPPKENRMMGILCPNQDFPFNDPAKERDVAEEDQVDNVTCNTAAFAIPLPSSTPCTTHRKFMFSEENASEPELKESCVKSGPNRNIGNIAAPNTLINVNVAQEEEVENISQKYVISWKGIATESPNIKSEEINEQCKNAEKTHKINDKHFVAELFKDDSKEDFIFFTHSSHSQESNHISEFKQELHSSQNEANQIETSLKSLRENSADSDGEVGEVLNEISRLKLIDKQPYIFKNEGIDPFDKELIQELLTHIEFSSDQHADKLQQLSIKIPRFRTGAIFSLGCDDYNIDKLIGEGSYAKVYKGIDTKSGKDIALKVQKPSWLWEYYICHQIKIRLSDPILGLAFMDIKKMYLLENGSIIMTDYAQYGSLLSLVNELRQLGVSFPNVILLHWMVELLNIAEMLQRCHIIHGDIKPDNVVIRSLPSLDSNEPSLQLIDMGRSIDMTLFPKNTTFKRIVTTKSFQCIEMQTNRPWTYQTDLYGIAGTMHCLYFGDYMKVNWKNNRWFINNVIPRYSVYRNIWDQFFHSLLNVESCDKLPDLTELKNMAIKTLLEDRSSSDYELLENVFHQKKRKDNRARIK